MAVEFGLVAIPFLLLFFALFEMAMSVLAFSTLEFATQAASRRIRTGEFQESGANSKTDFRALVCSNMSWLSAQCISDAYVAVQTFSNFTALAGTSPQAATSFNPSLNCFAPGGPTDIVLVRVYFKWRLFTPLFNSALENMGQGTGMRLMSSATAFRNEPYKEAPAQGAKC